MQRAELRKRLSAVCGCSDKEAARLLELHNYDLHRATDAFLNQSENPDLVALFDRYKESPQLISVDGTLAYLRDLGLEPEDPRSLTVAYLLGSPRMGDFERDKFMGFWQHALGGPVSLAAMKKVVDARHAGILQDPREFARCYAYCYDFIRSSDARIKSIAPGEAIDYWQLLFSQDPCIGAFPLAPAQRRLEQWYSFVSAEQRPVSRDLWVMFLRFLAEVVAEDPATLRGYDEMSSWPSVVDEYVEWLRENELLDGNEK